MILFSGYRRVKVGWELRGAVAGCLEKMMRKMGFDARQIFLQRRNVTAIRSAGSEVGCVRRLSFA